MSLGDMAFIALTIAAFSWVGGALYYGQRQSELAARARRGAHKVPASVKSAGAA